MNNRLITASLAVLVAAACACGALADGSVKGKVNFKGKPPKYKAIQMSADANCAAMHKDPVRPEYIVVNDNGTLRDVFIHVKSGLTKKDWPVPTTSVLIDQSGCTYKPHVFAVQAGQPILIRNSDGTSHNIHSLPKTNQPFNFGQPQKGMEKTETFKNPELEIKIKCDVHPWMGAWCHVVDHPFYAVTGADGTFEIKGLPAGEYEIEAWQEKLGTQTMKVKVGDGESKDIEFTFEKGEKKEDKDE
ncbi:MAG: hypothetical protein CHACPFDD_04026 [Phycisphaerae bacterium]|nr:hypothetical protein [Phycisphaerae bacterium]